MNDAILGQSIQRREDKGFLTGAAKFTADLNQDGQLHGAVLRSPYAHALIKSIDTKAAAALPGVAGVYTSADLLADGIGPLPCAAPAVVATVEPIIVPPRHALAHERVRHVGDPVAFVVAESLGAALDALELIEVDYEDLPAVVDSRAALAAGAAQIWDEAPGNLSYVFEKGDRAAVERAFAGAAHVVELDIVNNRVSPAPTEPRAAIGSYDKDTDTLNLLLTGQGVHGIRGQLANAVFKVAEDKLNVAAPFVGGGFGLKNFVYPEYVLLLWAARRLGRPVKWVAERNEDFLSSTQGRDIQATARLALDADGRFLGLSAAMSADMGAYLSSFGPGVSTNAASTAMGGVYAIRDVFMEVRGAFTNTVPVDAYRGAGKPESNYIIERLIEAAAVQTGIDAVQLRLLNVIDSYPYTSSLGIEIDTGDFKGNLEEAVRLANRAEFETRRAAAAKNGKLLGLGIACFLETARGAPSEGAEVKFLEDGTVELRLGTESNGQGHETAYSQIAADRFGLPLESFRYIQADTALVRAGNGHGGARSMHMGGSALVAALDAALAKARPIAAQMLQADEAVLEFTDGDFRVADSSRSVSLSEVARQAKGSLDSYERREDAPFTLPSGSHVAEVEIDRETGRMLLQRYLMVDDYGAMINPRLTEGQVHGGVTQGIGQAMLEEVAYDPETAQLLSGSLMDYTVPRASHLPAFEVHFRQTPTLNNPLGVKGSGQAGCIGAPQTVMAAVLDALKPLGITDIDMPATPERLWRAIRDASG
ncbi:MAG: xanthine dehydrogenase family protein molybdopterin-binding subunit [Alphaproteobacteria bacterium]|jgi:carbon-monoxide dehydrogenase large subunit|nr:xanthine dehydrogenase family protein molybdopterin-binding subunit [Alphaproteobacteria bacterium]MDP6872955.1 xanthine dehydrogenase family protein molybdopterin-binding subunit [Alphaproteobacteria bacterium]